MHLKRKRNPHLNNDILIFLRQNTLYIELYFFLQNAHLIQMKKMAFLNGVSIPNLRLNTNTPITIKGIIHTINYSSVSWFLPDWMFCKYRYKQIIIRNWNTTLCETARATISRGTGSTRRSSFSVGQTFCHNNSDSVNDDSPCY